MRKLIFLWIALVVVSLQALANDKVSFTASAPDAVAVGDQFRLAYTVTTQKVRDFRAPSIKGFDVLMGPSRSQQSSMQIVNGVSTSTSSITFTYILMATAEGSFTIPELQLQPMVIRWFLILCKSRFCQRIRPEQLLQAEVIVASRAIPVVLLQELLFPIRISLFCLLLVRPMCMNKKHSC